MSIATIEQNGMVPASQHDQWNEERKQFILKNFCGGAPEHIAEVFIRTAQHRGLSPEAKQIYLIKRGNNWTTQTSIDGYRSIAARTGEYAGSDDPVYTYDDPPAKVGQKNRPMKATVTVWRFVRGQRCSFTASALWDEYNAGQNMWVSMPHTMLAKCAESLALRKAFPDELSGIYSDDEMAQADNSAALNARTPAPPQRARAPRAQAEPVITDSGQFVDADGVIVDPEEFDPDPQAEFEEAMQTLALAETADELKRSWTIIHHHYKDDEELYAQAVAVKDRRKTELVGNQG